MNYPFYVHLYLRNYERYGITQDDPSGGVGKKMGKDILMKQRKDIYSNYIKTNPIARNNSRALENYLNAFIYTGDQNYLNSTEIDEKLFKAFVKCIEDMLANEYDKYDFGLDYDNNYTDVKHNVISPISTDTLITIQQLKDYFSSVNSMLRSGPVISNEEVREKLNILQRIIPKLLSTLEKKNKDIIEDERYSKFLSGDIKMSIKELQQLLKDPSRKDKDKSLATLLNYIFGVGAMPLASARGDVFEYMLGYISAMKQYKSDEITWELIKDNFVVGDTAHSTQAVYDFSAWDGALDNDDINKQLNFKKKTNWKQLGSAGPLTWQCTKPSPDKIDVIFNWNTAYTEPLKVSAKSYSISLKEARQSDSITILSNAPMLGLLNHPHLLACTGHWLNIVVKHVSSKDGSQVDAAAKQREFAHEIMKSVITLQALIGAKTTADYADTFILNAKNEKYIYVWQMSEIYDILFDFIDKMKHPIGTYVAFEGYPSGNKTEDKFIGSDKSVLDEKLGLKRSGLLFLKLHQYKLKVELKGKFLQKLAEGHGTIV